MNYEKLEKNICDTIKEGQIKIGYSENPVRLYYPIDSVAELLDIKITVTDDAQKRIDYIYKLLSGFQEACSKRLGTIEISNREERFCFLISKEGSSYVNEIYPDNPFLRQFIHSITSQNCTLEDIVAVFKSYSKNLYFENNEELGYILYFQDETIDEYVYCIKFDEFGATYHRFTKQDYHKLVG